MAGKKDIVEQALKLIAGKSREVGPKALRGKNTPTNAWHATEKPFTSYDWGLLGSATKPNVEGTSAENWAMDLARVGPWSSEKKIDLGFGTQMPVTVSGKGKAFNSLDDLQRAIAKAGGPDKFRQNMTAKGFGHLRVADEEFGGTSYVSLTPETFTVRDDPIDRASGGSIRQGYGPGGWVDDIVKMAGKAIMGEGEKVAPVSRIGMNYKDVTKRVPELTEAAKRLQAGEIGQSEYSAMVDRFKPVEPYASVPNPASVDDMVRALTANKREKIGKLADYPEGHPVALRLDIPAYTGHGVWVPTIHDQKTFKSISHEPAAHIAGAQFSIPENKALAVAAGGAKGPFATIDGSLLKTPPEAIHERAKAAMNDPDWVQVGMDPERHSYFYDRKTMQPVISAEEVIQVGPLVLARKPVYGNAEGFKYSKGGSTSRPQRSMGGNNSISGALNVARGLNGGE